MVSKNTVRTHGVNNLLFKAVVCDLDMFLERSVHVEVHGMGWMAWTRTCPALVHFACTYAARFRAFVCAAR